MVPYVLFDQSTCEGFDMGVRALRQRKVNYPEDWDVLLMGPESHRPAERLKREKEVYAISRLLGRVPELSKAPVQVIHREEPDFEVRSGTVTFGIEHTEMIPRAAAWRRRIRADMVSDGEQLPSWQYTKPALPNATLPTRSEIEDEIRTNPMGPGWEGDSVEVQWSSALLAVVIDKVSTARRYERFDANWLLIYDNWPAPVLCRSVAGPMTLAQLNDAGAFATFESILVLDDRRLARFGQDGFGCAEYSSSD
jgi:hypothetical protein